MLISDHYSPFLTLAPERWKAYFFRERLMAPET